MRSSTAKKQRTVLVLYTELAPYVLASLNAFVEHSKMKVELVRWPVNAEAPFDLSFHPSITVHERRTLDDSGLLTLAERTAPDLVFASGWVDKGYLKVCRAMRKKGVPTVMTFDTAWRGGAKQVISAVLGRFWVPSTFSHAWATGEQQARYARNLGFKNDRIRKGFYAADTQPFLNAYERERKNRSTHFRHRFICVARYISTKGQQELCDAFAALAESGRAGDWELHLVGTGAFFEDVRNSASGKHPKITHHGFVQAHAMPAFLKAGGVSVLPSLYEPWGVVVQEFACMGLPLLLSDAVGARERFLVEGENGYVHKAGNVVDLQRSFERTVQHSDT